MFNLCYLLKYSVLLQIVGMRASNVQVVFCLTMFSGDIKICVFLNNFMRKQLPKPQISYKE